MNWIGRKMAGAQYIGANIMWGKIMGGNAALRSTPGGVGSVPSGAEWWSTKKTYLQGA